MDHEVVPNPWQIFDWLLSLSWDHFSLHQRKIVKVTMEFEVPKDIFNGLHYPLARSNGFCVGSGKTCALVEKRPGPWHGSVIIKKLWKKKWRIDDEDKRMVKLDFNFFSQNYPFWAYGIKKIAHSFCGTWSLLLVHIWLTPSERSKGFVNWYLNKLEHGSWTFKSDHGKGHLPWSDFMIHGVHRPWKSMHARRAGANRSVYKFIGGKDLGIQQGTSVWIGLPKFALRCS